MPAEVNGMPDPAGPLGQPKKKRRESKRLKYRDIEPEWAVDLARYASEAHDILMPILENRTKKEYRRMQEQYIRRNTQDNDLLEVNI